jgi:hypothetical protein
VPWTLTPLTSRAVGAWLLALAAGLASTLYERDWRRIRVAVPTFAAMPVFQAIALARYSDTVDWSSTSLRRYLAYLASLLGLGAFGLVRVASTLERGGRRLATPAPRGAEGEPGSRPGVGGFAADASSQGSRGTR